MALCSRFVYIRHVDHSTDGEGNWTASRVKARLIDAFRALPSHPMFSRQHEVRPTLGDNDDHAAALSWAARFVPDRHERLVLLTWARCRAEGASVRTRSDALGWKRMTAEGTRDRATRRIVAGLNATKLGLDSRIKAPGPSHATEADADLAPA